LTRLSRSSPHPYGKPKLSPSRTWASFSVSDRATREGRNPATGERLQIPASKAAKFSAAAKLKRALNP
jgi:nucleoid DNA-binding protein